MGFFALGFHRQGGRTRKPLGRRLSCLPFAKAHCNWSCVRSRALPSGAVIFGLQAITDVTERAPLPARELWSLQSGRLKPHFVLREIPNRVMLGTDQRAKICGQSSSRPPPLRFGAPGRGVKNTEGLPRRSLAKSGRFRGAQVSATTRTKFPSELA